MKVYYNEWEPFAAAWLRALIAAGHLPSGDVDERSITEVRASDLAGYGQCHFFAGIGGWPLALAWAGWPYDREVWTGSCPCQPFSVAGRGGGAQDERHLWPAFGRLIAECRPATVLGEQVASRDGRTWLTAVRADVEDMGYAVGAADLCAAGVGAPHIRQRLYWVADADGQGGSGLVASSDIGQSRHGGWSGQANLQRIATAPFERDDLWPQPLLCGVAHGVSGRMERLRGYGNAIVPQVAAAFVQAYLDTERGLT